MSSTQSSLQILYSLHVALSWNKTWEKRTVLSSKGFWSHFNTFYMKVSNMFQTHTYLWNYSRTFSCNICILGTWFTWPQQVFHDKMWPAIYGWEPLSLCSYSIWPSMWISLRNIKCLNIHHHSPDATGPLLWSRW